MHQLRDLLARAPDVDSACQTAVAALAARGRLGASAYVARAGRLRCLAAAGVSHVLDGVPVASGPVGRAMRSGAEQRDVDPAGMTDALCVPLRSGAVVGVLAVAADDGLQDADVELIRGVAAALGERIEELGGPPADGPAARLAQHSAALAGLEEPGRIERATLIAALDLAEMDSGLLLRRDDPGAPLRAAAAAGGLTAGLLALDPAAVLALELLVEDGSSVSISASGPMAHAPLPEGLEALRALGARSVVVAPLIARASPLGVLVLADARALHPSTDRVELVELIATQSASCLRTATAVAELRVRAATDPLTGLGHRGSFDEALATAHRRPATAVCMIDLDRFKELNDRHGHQEGDRALKAVATALDTALRRGDRLFRLGGDEFAALLVVRVPGEALAAAQRMRQAVLAADAGVTVSIGVAISHNGESDEDLVGRADRALYDAKGRGRDGVVVDGDPSAPVLLQPR